MRVGRRGLFQVFGLMPLVAKAVVTEKKQRCDADWIEAEFAAGRVIGGKELRCRRGFTMAGRNPALFDSKLDFIGVNGPGITITGDRAWLVNNVIRSSS
jgi:hypothetical protein